ncbi:uncharacterized protein ARMOST_11170 [Armillaria ostoyae]|uniref:Uncharacterized protein n=1 Tax=Armillaria ostoyae TaxID=47428 RepID=A0A284RGE6_ARMOS|nr:uncharacterized protein ARMOST_11170 [Armillaria ostoyae]
MRREVFASETKFLNHTAKSHGRNGSQPVEFSIFLPQGRGFNTILFNRAVYQLQICQKNGTDQGILIGKHWRHFFRVKKTMYNGLCSADLQRPGLIFGGGLSLSQNSISNASARTDAKSTCPVELAVVELCVDQPRNYQI